jgi:formylglycine-generating enzyme
MSRRGRGNVIQTSAPGYRLPTEVEWQYAARGGVANRRFPWGDSDTIQHVWANYISSDSWIFDTSPTRGYHPTYNDGTMPYTSPVGSFAANGYGLHDMAGNVYDWCFDRYGGDQRRRVHGGGWRSGAANCRVDGRNYGEQVAGYESVGFRTVMIHSAD